MDYSVSEPIKTVLKYAWTIHNFKDIADNWTEIDSYGYDLFSGCCQLLFSIDVNSGQPNQYEIKSYFKIGEEKFFNQPVDNNIKKHIKEKHSIDTSSWTAYIVHRGEHEHKSCNLSIEGLHWSAPRTEVDNYFGAENSNGSFEFRAELKMTEIKQYRLKNLTFNVRSGHISSDFGHLLEKNELCDFTIETSDESFKVHKAVLAARSAVFRAMLRSDMRESRENVLKLDHVDTQVVKKFVDYIYTDKLEFGSKLSGDESSEEESSEGKEKQDEEKVEEKDETIDEDDIELLVHLMRLADQYELLRLRELCEQQLNRGIEKESIFKILKLADSYKIKDLRSYALEFAGIHRVGLATEGLDTALSHSPELRKDLLAALTGK